MAGSVRSEAARERVGEDHAYALWGWAPVVAKGHVRGRPFSFRARHEGWTFTALLDSDGDPDLYDPPEDVDGVYRDGDTRFLYLQGTVENASYMAYDDVEAVLARCIEGVRGVG
jgi:hypothetical protein